MEANILNLTRLFELNRRYVVPLFQRPYVWKLESHWRPLWEDIENVAEKVLAGESPRAHFIGAVVLEQQRSATSEIDSRVVIDGQQRLTTLQLVLEALSDACMARGFERVHAKLLKLTRNDDAFAEGADEKFKVWPTTSDQDAFRRVMEQRSADGVRGEFPDGHETGISGAFVFFSEAVEEWIDAGEQAALPRAEAVYTTLREFIRLVVIDLAPEDDAQAIFETLNARGEPLRPSDLVKNVLLQRVRDERGDLALAYHQYWKRFDDEAAYWSSKIGSGRAARHRIDIFLQHFLTVQLRKEVAVGHLYAEFRDYLREKLRSATGHLDALAAYAGTYASFEARERRDPFEEFFRRMRVLEVGTAFPFLLELFHQHRSAAAAIQRAVGALESFLVRRMVCHLNTRGYNRLFLDLLKTLDAPSDEIGDRVIQRLLDGKADSNRWPTDAEFRSAWLSEPIYERQRQSRVRMLLEALEEQLHTEHTEGIDFREALTLEHILPQEWTTHWPLPPSAPSDAAAERDRALQSIGNLTLLTGTLNPAVSNGPWETKRQGLERHSLLMLNRTLVKEGSWGEAQIRSRGEALFDIALRIWPRPAGVDERIASPPKTAASDRAPASVRASVAPASVSAEPPAAEPRPTPGRSTVQSPVRLAWSIAEEMTAGNPLVSRKELVAACVARGVAFWTASTQISAWRAAHRATRPRDGQDARETPEPGELDFTKRELTLELLGELRKRGLDDKRFRRLHHFPPDRAPEYSLLDAHMRYSMKPGAFIPEGTNATTARRLDACLACLRSGSSWEEAIAEALQRFPVPTRTA